MLSGLTEFDLCITVGDNAYGFGIHLFYVIVGLLAA